MRARFTWLVSSLLLGACAFGFRGSASFDEFESMLVFDRTLIVDLPSTDLAVTSYEPELQQTPLLTWTGRWTTFAGTTQEARDAASAPRLVAQRYEGVVRLIADIPLALDGLVDLELEEIRMPNGLALEIFGDNGDVRVAPDDEFTGTFTGPITIDVGDGDIEVVHASNTVSVSKGRGRLEIDTPEAVDVESGGGTIRIDQRGFAAVAGQGIQPIRIRARRGDVFVAVGLPDDDLGVTYDLRGESIRVDTFSVEALASGAWRRTIGSGAVVVEIRADRGDVTVASSLPAEDEP